MAYETLQLNPALALAVNQGSTEPTLNQRVVQEQKPDMLGYFKFGVVGSKIMLLDKIFTIDIRRAVILEKKLLKAFDEFISEA